MDTWGKAINQFLFPLWEKRLKKRPVLNYLNELRTSQFAHSSIIESIQNERLVRLLHHAQKSSPYYREAWNKNGIDIEKSFLVSQLKDLPILTRQNAKDSVSERRSEHGPSVYVTKTTGGTTGEPLKIEYDRESEFRRQAMRLRGFGWAGYQVGLPVLHYWGVATTQNHSLGHEMKKKADHLLKREKWIDCTLQSDNDKQSAVETIRSHRPKVIFCYAQAMVELAKYINKNKLRTWDGIRVVCGAEKVDSTDRMILEQAFGNHVFETYGCREFMLIGSECEKHDGLHVSSEHLIVEIVDDQGMPVAPGTTGNVVITDLFNYANPLIRYQNGDLASFKADQDPCSCGRHLPRIDSIEGRKTEILKDGLGNSVGGMIFNLIFSPLAEEVSHYQIRQKKDLSITVSVVSNQPLEDGSKNHIISQCKKYLPCLLYTSPSPRDATLSRMPSSA